MDQQLDWYVFKNSQHTIAATPWVLLVVPRPTNATTFLKDDKVSTVVSLDEVYGHIHA